MRRQIFSDNLESTCSAVHAVLDGVLGTLERHGWIHSHQDRFLYWICLEEALSNAVKYGNHNDPNATIGLEIIQEDDWGRITVRDSGPGFDPGKLCMPESTAMHGRGVCLIKHYMDRVAYDQATHQLFMERKISKPAGADGNCGGDHGAVHNF